MGGYPSLDNTTKLNAEREERLDLRRGKQKKIIVTRESGVAFREGTTGDHSKGNKETSQAQLVTSLIGESRCTGSRDDLT